MGPNTIGVWRLSSALPMRKKLRLRLGLVLYVIGLRRQGVQLAGEEATVPKRIRDELT
jgi:hypothetical protein